MVPNSLYLYTFQLVNENILVSLEAVWASVLYHNVCPFPIIESRGNVPALFPTDYSDRAAPFFYALAGVMLD